MRSVIQLGVAMMLGVNINFILWPPPGTLVAVSGKQISSLIFVTGHITDGPLSGKMYHLKFCAVFFVLTWLMGYGFSLAHSYTHLAGVCSDDLQLSCGMGNTKATKHL
jgi:hypothetical protein